MKHKTFPLVTLFVVTTVNFLLGEERMTADPKKPDEHPAGVTSQNQSGNSQAVLTPASNPVRPATVTRSSQDGQVAMIRLGLHFSTGVVMPEKVSSVVVGDPTLFKAEHSEKEPRLVFVKPLTDRPAESNMIVSMITGQTMSLLLKSAGDRNAESGPSTIDFLVGFRPPRRAFLIEETTLPSVMIPATVALDEPGKAAITQASHPEKDDESITSQAGHHSESLVRLLKIQEESPFPGSDKTGLGVKIGRIYEQVDSIYILFSVLNSSSQNVELLPPQIQLSGKAKRRTGTAEQIPVREYILSRHKLSPGERVDGVVLFEKPPFKQSHETYYLQVADSSAVDIPVLTAINLKASQALEGGPEDGRR